MILLGITIVIALLVMIALPIALGVWLNKKYALSWRIIFLGVFAHLATQMVISLLLGGLNALVQNEVLLLSENSYYWLKVGVTILLSAIIGVVIRWAMMRFMREKLDNLLSAIGIGLGYGMAESIMIMGFPLLVTFISMIRNVNSGLPEVAEAWALSPLIPLAISLERIAAFVLHIAVTILILQVFKRKRWTWLLAAIGLELVVNGLLIGLTEAGLKPGYVILIASAWMFVNIYILYRLDAFDLKISTDEQASEPDPELIEPEDLR